MAKYQRVQRGKIGVMGPFRIGRFRKSRIKIEKNYVKMLAGLIWQYSWFIQLTLFMVMLRVTRSAAITAASTRNDPNLLALLGTGWASGAGDLH